MCVCVCVCVYIYIYIYIKCSVNLLVSLTHLSTGFRTVKNSFMFWFKWERNKGAIFFGWS